MKVRAVEPGWYGNTRRRVGDVFELTDEKHFSDCQRKTFLEGGKHKNKGWMEKVEEASKSVMKEEETK